MAFNLALVIVGTTVLLLGILSNYIERSLLSKPLLALIIGVVIGFWFNSPDILTSQLAAQYKIFIEELARITLAIGLMGIALRLPRKSLLNFWRPNATLLGPVMILMWLTSGLIIWGIIGLPFWIALLIGAVLTPTDPVLASSIVTGNIAEQEVAADVRHTMSFESGVNDGLAYPFIFLPVLLSTLSTSQAVSDWFLKIVLQGVLAAVLIGAAMGYGAGRILRWAQEREHIGKTSFLAFALALSFIALGAIKLVGSDGLLGVFVAGVAFTLAMPEKERKQDFQQEHFQEAVNRFFTLPIFVFFGMILPWHAWLQMGWLSLALVVLVLLFRRLPYVVGLNRFMGKAGGLKNSLFIGWFGPIGVGAIYYAALAERTVHQSIIWELSSLVIVSSVAVHGVSGTPFTRLYGKWK